MHVLTSEFLKWVFFESKAIASFNLQVESQYVDVHSRESPKYNAPCVVDVDSAHVGDAVKGASFKSDGIPTVYDKLRGGIRQVIAEDVQILCNNNTKC